MSKVTTIKKWEEYDAAKGVLVDVTEVTESEDPDGFGTSAPYNPYPFVTPIKTAPFLPIRPPTAVSNSGLCATCAAVLARGESAVCGCVRPGQGATFCSSDCN